MALIKTLKDKLGNIIYPQTKEKAVYSDTNERLDNKLSNLHIDSYGKPYFNNLTIGVDGTRAPNTTIGKASVVQGWWQIASNDWSGAFGYNNIVTGAGGFAQNSRNTASGLNSSAKGDTTIASGQMSSSEGYNTISSGDYSHVEGNTSKAYGRQSHAEGFQTLAYAHSSHAEGGNTQAGGSSTDPTIGTYAHSEGSGTQANASYSHAEGNGSIAGGPASHAGGTSSQANGNDSFSHGLGTIANGAEQAVFGRYNNADANSLFILGNGTSDGARATAFRVLNDGSVRIVWSTINITMSMGSKDGTLLYNFGGNLPLKYNMQFTGLTIAINTYAQVGTHDYAALYGYPRVLAAYISTSAGIPKGLCNIILTTSGIYVMNGGVAIASTDLVRFANDNIV